MRSTVERALEISATPVAEASPGCLVEAARCWGRLAPWWMELDVLGRIERILNCPFPLPRLPSTRGTCLALFSQQPRGRWPLLRNCLPLPLLWHESDQTPTRLPPKLAGLVERIRKQLRLPGWTLDLHPDLTWNVPDLYPLDELLEVDSAWAPLAASLLVAAEGGHPDPGVWATAAWGSGVGIQPVDLEAKLNLAVQFGVRQLFVPASQVLEARDQARRLTESLTIGSLVEGTTEPRVALRDLLTELDVPPSRHESPETRAAWFLRCPDGNRARDYYRTSLLPDIAARLRAQWQQHVPSSCSHLVTIASDNPELAFLALHMTQAQRCLVLYSEDKRDQFEQLQELATGSCVDCPISPRPFPSAEALVEGCRAAVSEFAGGLAPAQLVLDLTPGTKDMSIALLTAAAQRGNRLIYLRHRREGPKVVPFTERVLTWTAGEPQMTERELKASGQSTMGHLS